MQNVHGVMNIIIVNGLSELSSNPEQSHFYFTLY